jgi:hypothetical protein
LDNGGSGVDIFQCFYSAQFLLRLLLVSRVVLSCGDNRAKDNSKQKSKPLLLIGFLFEDSFFFIEY